MLFSKEQLKNFVGVRNTTKIEKEITRRGYFNQLLTNLPKCEDTSEITVSKVGSAYKVKYGMNELIPVGGSFATEDLRKDFLNTLPTCGVILEPTETMKISGIDIDETGVIYSIRRDNKKVGFYAGLTDINV